MQTGRETANNPPQQKLWSFWFLTGWGSRGGEALSGGQQPTPQLHPPHLPHPVPPLLLTLHWPPTEPPASSGNPHFVCVYHRSFHYFDQNHHCGHGFQVQHTWKQSEVWISVTKPLILAFPEASRSHLARKVSGLHQHRYTLLSQDIQSFTKFCKSPLTRCAVISFYNPFREPLLSPGFISLSCFPQLQVFLTGQDLTGFSSFFPAFLKVSLQLCIFYSSGIHYPEL